MDEKEIFSLIANGIINSLPEGQRFQSVVLNIKRLQGVVGFSGFFQDENGNNIPLEVNMGYQYAKAIQKLYERTQNHLLNHINWNKAIFTLYPSNKYEIQYIWDQDLQDLVDNYNRDI